MSLTLTTITPRMDLAHVAEALACDRSEAAFVVLELIAEGHWAKDFDALGIEELMHALTRACVRMDSLGIEP